MQPPSLDMADSMFTLSDLLRDPTLAARITGEYQQLDRAVRKRRAARAARVVHRRQQPGAETELDRARRKVAALRSPSSAPMTDLQAARQRLPALASSIYARRFSSALPGRA